MHLNWGKFTNWPGNMGAHFNSPPKPPHKEKPKWSGQLFFVAHHLITENNNANRGAPHHSENSDSDKKEPCPQ